MNTRRSRIQRKADRVEKTETDRRFDVALGALKRTRDEARTKANADHAAAVAKAVEARTAARSDAEATYEQGRAKLLKRLAGEETRAAA